MDASPSPVLSRWTDVAGSADVPSRHLPGAMPRIDGLAASPAEALARAAAQWPGCDVLLMHADAGLPVDGWRRLYAAWRDGDWDVLSPAIAGTDDTDADARAWTQAEHESFASTDWSPLCALWRGHRVADAAAGAAPARIGC